MHELSICRSIADIVGRHAEGRSVRTVHLQVGQLRQIVPNALVYCWSLVNEETSLAGTELAVEHIPAAIRCRACDHEHENDHGRGRGHDADAGHGLEPAADHLGDHTGHRTGTERIQVLEGIFDENDSTAARMVRKPSRRDYAVRTWISHAWRKAGATADVITRSGGGTEHPSTRCS